MKTKNFIFLLLIGILISGCSNNDDDGIDCALVDFAAPGIFIRLVDETGANLIENNTIDPEKITVEGDFEDPRFWYNPPHEYAEPDSPIRRYDHTLSLFVPRVSTLEYTVHLNESSAVVIKFEAKFAQLPCEISYYIPTNLTYNGQSIASENMDYDELVYLAEIEI